MKLRIAVAYLAVLLSVSPAFALRLDTKVGPEWTKEFGITMQATKKGDDSITFTVTRYLDKAPQFAPESDIILERTASLKVGNAAGVMAETTVAAIVNKDSVAYRFSLSRACIAHSTFSLWEAPVHKDPENKERVFGSDTFFVFDLAEHAAPFKKPPPPLHP